jgi:hypothetical protein
MAFEKNAPSIVGAGFSRPIAWIIDQGGENPPLRQIGLQTALFVLPGHRYCMPVQTLSISPFQNNFPIQSCAFIYPM